MKHTCEMRRRDASLEIWSILAFMRLSTSSMLVFPLQRQAIVVVKTKSRLPSSLRCTPHRPVSGLLFRLWRLQLQLELSTQRSVQLYLSFAPISRKYSPFYSDVLCRPTISYGAPSLGVSMSLLVSSELRKEPLPETDGTLHQSRVKPRSKFLRPSSNYADAVQWDSEQVVYSGKEEDAVKHKLDRMILPLVALGTIFNQLVQNVSNNRRWTVALGVFYALFVFTQLPSNVLLRRIGANRLYFLAMSLWGLCTVLTAFARGYSSLILLRIFLGLGQGTYSGILYYLTFWYKRDELAKRYALAASFSLPGSIGGLLAFGLVRIHTAHLSGWQILVIAEGVPTILLAFTILLFLPSYPYSAWFLSPRERAIAHARLQRDQRPQATGGPPTWDAVKAVLRDLNAWLLLLAYSTQNVGVVSMTYFIPTIINRLGFSPLTTQGLTAAPYATALLANFLITSNSDRTRQRGLHAMSASLLAFTGYIVLIFTRNMPVRVSTACGYFALFLVVVGNTAVSSLLFAWMANTLAPTSKRGVGTAFILASNIISIASPQIYFDPEDNFRKGFAIAASCAALSCLSSATLRVRLSRLNDRNTALCAALAPETVKQAEELQLGEIADTDARYRFTL
ncbi:MFS domain-containing protein [Mycena kentingensis (nom. inval.)]|nr:MFS domain-containing protein [Mycena kentingensis (nom. inval.)]